MVAAMNDRGRLGVLGDPLLVAASMRTGASGAPKSFEKAIEYSLHAERLELAALGVGDAGDHVDLVLDEQRNGAGVGGDEGDVRAQGLADRREHDRQLRVGPRVVVGADELALEVRGGDRLGGLAHEPPVVDGAVRADADDWTSRERAVTMSTLVVKARSASPVPRNCIVAEVLAA